MPLTLHPDIDRISRIDLEEHVADLQRRRLSSAIIYYEGQNAKYQSAVNKADRRLIAKYETLGKRLITAEKAIEAIEKLANEIQEIKNDREQNAEMIQYMDKEAEDE